MTMLTFTVRRVIREVIVNVSSDTSTFSSGNILGSPTCINIPVPLSWWSGLKPTLDD